MYSRRPKSKKIGKSMTSNWGPRLALEEQEKEAKALYAKIGSLLSNSSSVYKNPYANPRGMTYEKREVKPLHVLIPQPPYDYVSLPSTETWKSSCDERENEGNINLKDSEIVEVPVPNIFHDFDKVTMEIRGKCEGITMVYVPMERIENPLLENENNEEGENFGEIKDPDCDSLLESFDSVIFKPKFRTNLSKTPTNSSPELKNNSDKNSPLGSRGSSENLEPTGHVRHKKHKSTCSSRQSSKTHSNKSGSPQNISKQNSPRGAEVDNETSSNNCEIIEERDNDKISVAHNKDIIENLPIKGKNLRFSEFLDVKPLSPSPHHNEEHSFLDINNNEPLSGFSNYSTATMLSCGHLTGDNYSTLSSVHSRGGGGNLTHSTYEGVSEKSALQQLRDLSILIGGTFHSPDEDSEKIRKNSNTSADSGKGPSPVASNLSTPPSSELKMNFNSAEQDSCIFRPECKECLLLSKKEKTEKSAKKVLKRKSKYLKNNKSKKSGTLRSSYSSYYSTNNQNPKNNSPEFNRQINQNAPHGLKNQNNHNIQNNHVNMPNSKISCCPCENGLFTIREEEEFLGESNKNGHSHPQCWLSADPSMGWSDLESVYNGENEGLVGECEGCWEEVKMLRKRNVEDGTIERTKRMFIWLNKRTKEFSAPWWEAKKKSSIKWLVSKALGELSDDLRHLTPFKESKKDGGKMRLREEVMSGLVSGKLYLMALRNLYELSGTDPPLLNQLENCVENRETISLWGIIKILSRKGVYVAQPSDMKLTEGTLRQKKPLRIAAHIALIEAIIGLYAQEILTRDKMLKVLHSFGHTLKPDSQTSEELLISWINSAITTLKAHILSNHSLLNSSLSRAHRWLSVPLLSEIRDLNDGIGLLSLFLIYFSNILNIEEIHVPEPGEPLPLHLSTLNQNLIQSLSTNVLNNSVYSLSPTDFLHVHGHMKMNIVGYLVDLFVELEVEPSVRVNRLTHCPLRLIL